MDKSIKQKLFSGGLWVFGGKILGLISGLAVNALLARLLTPNDMGVYFLIASLVSFSMLFSLLGMERSIVRIVSESLALEQIERACEAVKYVLQLGLLSSIIVAIFLVSGIGKWISERIFGSFLISDIIYFPAIWVVLFTLQRLLAETFRGFHDIRFATIFNGLVSSVVSAVVLCLILWKLKKADINLALLIIITANAINILLAFLFLMKRTGILSSKKSGFISRSDVMRSSWALYLLNFGLFFLQNGHLWLLAYYSSKDSVAIYGAVFRLVVLITSTLSIIKLAILPTISHLYTKKRYSEVEKVLRTTATISGIPSIIGLLLIIFLGKSMLLILYGDYYVMGYTALIVLCAAHLINVLTGAPGALLVMASKERVLLFACIVGVSFGISLSILLVHSLDYLGVSVGAGVGIILQNLFMAWYCVKKMSINTFMDFREINNIAKAIRKKWQFYYDGCS